MDGQRSADKSNRIKSMGSGQIRQHENKWYEIEIKTWVKINNGIQLFI